MRFTVFWRAPLVGALLAVLVVGRAAAEAPQPGERFHPVLASSAMVVTQEEHATKVGVDILKAGGNAVDAAVAVAFALAVTLPRAGNLGGGGFMVVHDAKDGGDHAVDYRETAPAGASRDMFLDASGNADPNLSRWSGRGVGVPGTVRGMALAEQRYGSGKFTWAELIAPAIELAAKGIPVSETLAEDLAKKDNRARLGADTTAAAVFYGNHGEPLARGDTLRQPQLAATLRQIAENGPDAFYTGAIAQKVAAAVDAHGGSMTPDDLAHYRAVIRDPVTGDYMGYHVVSMPPPSSGGVHLIEILNILSGVPLREYGLDSAESIHWIAEAARRAYADRAEYLGDPDFVDVPVAQLLSPAYAARRRAEIDPNRATPSSEVKPGFGPLPASAIFPESSDTTHFSIVDKDGGAVSNTYTLNFLYGVGFMAGDTGVLLNNELDDFSAKPGVPNAYGLIGNAANAVAPKKRPLSSMTPTIVTKDGKVFLVTGSPGGSRIITTVLQIVLDVIAYDRNIATATAAPRVHHQWLPDEIRIEDGISADTVHLLEAMGYKVVRRAPMGATQSIEILPDGTRAGASDPREPEGLAAGY